MKIKTINPFMDVPYPTIEKNNNAHLERLLRENNALQKMQLQKHLEKAKHQTPKIDFDINEQTLFVDGKSVKTRGFRLELLALLFKNEKNKSRKWNNDRLFDKLQGTASKALGEEKQFPQKLYSACDGLNKYIASKTGINDVLWYSKFSVQINPRYIQTK